MRERMARSADAPSSGTERRPRAAQQQPPHARPPDDASDAARALMHGIFVGEIQALEGAGRTCHDFETGTGDGTRTDTVPFALKLDMARQAWDEARHVEISVKLSDWMGTEIGQFAENTVLFEAACSNDPGPAAGRRQPCARGPGHRRVHHDEGVRRSRRRPVPRVLRGLDAGRRGDPREDGLATGCARSPRTIPSGARRRSSSRASSTSCSATAAHASESERVADRPRPPVPRARRLHRRRGRRDRQDGTTTRSTSARRRCSSPGGRRRGRGVLSTRRWTPAPTVRR